MDDTNNKSEPTYYFRHFAKSLWHELIQANAQHGMCGFIDVTVDDDPTDPTDYLSVIARHDLDLVCQVIKFYNPGDTDEQIRRKAETMAYFTSPTFWPFDKPPTPSPE